MKSYCNNNRMLALILCVIFTLLSCEEEAGEKFQQLEGVSPEGVKVVEVLGGEMPGMQKIFKKMAVAQQFTPHKKYLLYEMRIVLSRKGSFFDSDNLKVALCYDNADTPTSPSGYYAYDVKLNAISEEKSEHIFVFKNRPIVYAGNKYWIKVYFANSEIGDNANNYIVFYHTPGDAYPSNYLKTFDGTQWNEVTADMGITIWGKEQL
ncbi:MAG: hypothetical protein N2316_01280 [Spirochaetes bacterium]|nr:hypothetical protein [Spirochaetota bacterium]